MNNKKACPKCNRNITPNNFKRHINSCDGTYFVGSTKPKNPNINPNKGGLYECPICQREFTTYSGMGHHKAVQHDGCNGQRGRLGWNKGLGKTHDVTPKPLSEWPHTRVYYKKCKDTGKMFWGKSQHRFSPSARISKKLYRERCKFSFSSTKYPELFNIELIRKYGWYSPTNRPNTNLTGVTWDHLYRIEEGYKNNISPHILSHPANAEMVTWQENVKRNKSQLTLEELIRKIEDWTSKSLKSLVEMTGLEPATF